ncbi:hypothetical protein DFH08DRAFT_813688 [Mycena albidolilacea]|uniref:Uncharacterized protein n=1 Tax=Mycena albidolilacea TaxID=1033008 RepID=A0AAD7EKI7_9AGAR|nr:hypothetical protein DFH08DRAFT_813688 [Mycena albidolilacea]
MDIDTQNMEDNDNSGGKRRYEEHEAAKVRMVPGPQHEEYDKACDKQAFHKDQALVAKQKSHKLTLENQQLLAQLEEAERTKAEHIAFLNSMNEELARKSQAIAEVQKTDETIQIRAYSYLQSKKMPQRTPPPCRGTRTSLDPVRNSGTRTIEIPLDPILVTPAPSGKSKLKSKAKLAATPAFADLLGTDVATLSGLIGKLEQLLVGNEVMVDVVKATPKKRNKPKSLASKALVNCHTNLNEAGPQSTLRRSTYNKFGIEQAADFHIYNPAEPAKVAACEDGLADLADDLFQWDFSPGYTKCRWNDPMIAKVVDAVLEADGEDGEIAEGGVERNFLEALMREKLGRFRGAWKGFQPHFNERLGRLETMREARDHCVQTIIATIEIKTGEGNTGDVATWRRLLEMVKHLGQQGMSSEEEDEVQVDDAKVLIYKVKVCIWRKPRVVEYLRFVDAQTGLFKKHQQGPTPTSRIRSGAPGTSEALCGLPKSLYSGEWLKKASPAYLKELKVSKEVFGLFIAATDRMAL